MKKVFTILFLVVCFLGGLGRLQADPTLKVFDVRELPNGMCKDLLKVSSQDLVKGACLDSFNECKDKLTELAIQTVEFKKFFYKGEFLYAAPSEAYLQYYTEFKGQHVYSDMKGYKDEPGDEIPYTGSFDSTYQSLKNDLDKNCAPTINFPIFSLIPIGGPSNQQNPPPTGGSPNQQNPGLQGNALPHPLVVAHPLDRDQNDTTVSGCSMMASGNALSGLEGLWIFGLSLVPVSIQRLRRSAKKMSRK